MREGVDMRRFAVLTLLATALVGCGGEAGDGGADPASVLPAGSAVYLDFAVRPEGVRETRLKALAGRVLGTDDPGKKIVELIEKAADEPGSYAKDVEPWLGERAALALSGFDAEEPQIVAAIAATDTGAAADAVERQSAEDKAKKGTYKDTEYFVDEDGDAFGVVGDFVVFADSETGMRRVIDARDGRRLTEDERFTAALDRLPDERVGTLYLDVRTIAREAGAVDPAARAVLDSVLGNAPPVAVAALAEEDHLAFETRMPKSGGVLGGLSALGATELVGEVPGDAWGVVGAPELGKTAREAMKLVAGPLGGAVLGGQLEQQLGISLERDVFAWIGDVAVFVRGKSVDALDGGVVIDVTDAAKARAAIPKLVGALQIQAGLAMKPASVEGASLAFELGDGTTPRPVVVALAEDRAVIAYGREAAAAGLQPGERFKDGEAWERAGAMLDGLEPSMVLDAQVLLGLVATTTASDPGFAQARPYLERIDVLAAGGGADGDEVRSRLSVGIAPH